MISKCETATPKMKSYESGNRLRMCLSPIALMKIISYFDKMASRLSRPFSNGTTLPDSYALRNPPNSDLNNEGIGYAINDWIRLITTALFPEDLRRWLRTKQRLYRLQWPRVGTVREKTLWRVTPISRIFGLNRGLPIDRYYIEQFLSEHASDIQGRGLEIGDNFYPQKIGGDCVTTRDV